MISDAHIWLHNPTRVNNSMVKKKYIPALEQMTSPDSYYNTVIAIAKSDALKGIQLATIDLQTVQEAMNYIEAKKSFQAFMDHQETENIDPEDHKTLSDYRKMVRQGVKLTEEQVAHKQQLIMERYR